MLEPPYAGPQRGHRSIGADMIALTRDLTLDRTNEYGHKYNSRVWHGRQGRQWLCWKLSGGKDPSEKAAE